MLCVCLWSEISYNLLTTRPSQLSVKNITSINTVFKQSRFYLLNPLQKGDELELRAAHQGSRDLDARLQLVTLAVTLPFPPGTQLLEAA